MEKLEKDKDGNPVIVVPFHIRHLGPRQSIVLDRSYVARTLSLVNLAPDIIVAVMQGKTPPEMTLAKSVNNLPEDWQEQRELFGF